MVGGGEKKKGKEKTPQAGVVKGNWRDVVASVAAEPRLSEVHEAQSHDSCGSGQGETGVGRVGGVGKRVIRKREVNKMEM